MLGAVGVPEEESAMMPSLDLRRNEIVIGVDTHKDEHVAVALDGIGCHRGSFTLLAF